MAFDFDFQVYFEKDVWPDPGDTITTTCTYESFATFETGTDQEMGCPFTIHTPVGALADDGDGVAIHGDNAWL